MKKYIAIIDYRAKNTTGMEVKELNAKGILDAMQECREMMDDEVYLIKIAERKGKRMRIEGADRTTYQEILCNRGGALGWHECTERYGEFSSIWARDYYASTIIDYHIINLG